MVLILSCLTFAFGCLLNTVAGIAGVVAGVGPAFQQLALECQIPPAVQKACVRLNRTFSSDHSKFFDPAGLQEIRAPKVAYG